jgi:hypothetical protein
MTEIEPQVKTKPIGLPVKLRNWSFSLCLGLLIGVFFHYLLYRFSLPKEPFIYANF